jgi:hypothetical protein
MKKVAMVIVIMSLVVFGTISVNAQNRTKDVKEWLLLRGNEEAHKGKIVTWKCVYDGAASSNLAAVSKFFLKDDWKYAVYVSGGWESIYPQGGWESGSVDAWLEIEKKYKRIHKGDIFEITGEFLSVAEYDYHTGIYLKPIKMKKIGFVE